MLAHQEVKLFEEIIRTRRRGLIGGSVSLQVGSEVSKAHARSSFSLILPQAITLNYVLEMGTHPRQGHNGILLPSMLIFSARNATMPPL